MTIMPDHPLSVRVRVMPPTIRVRVVDVTRELPEDCYACDADATGIRDRRPEGGEIEAACERHREPRLRARRVCMYCTDTVRPGSVVVDGDLAHRGCHEEACRS